MEPNWGALLRPKLVPGPGAKQKGMAGDTAEVGLPAKYHRGQLWKILNRHALLENFAIYYNANGIPNTAVQGCPFSPCRDTLTDEQKTRKTRGQTATFDLEPGLCIHLLEDIYNARVTIL